MRRQEWTTEFVPIGKKEVDSWSKRKAAMVSNAFHIFTSQYFLLFTEYQDRGVSVMTYLAKDPILIITSIFLNILLILTIIAGVIYLR